MNVKIFNVRKSVIFQWLLCNENMFLSAYFHCLLSISKVDTNRPQFYLIGPTKFKFTCSHTLADPAASTDVCFSGNCCRRAGNMKPKRGGGHYRKISSKTPWPEIIRPSRRNAKEIKWVRVKTYDVDIGSHLHSNACSPWSSAQYIACRKLENGAGCGDRIWVMLL